MPDERGLARLSAIVTGGSSGIGRGIAVALAEDGYDLTLVGRGRAALDDVAARAEAVGSTSNIVTGDVAHEPVIEAVVRSHRETFGRLDVVVNSAGVGIPDKVETLSSKRLDLHLAVNLRATMLMCRETLPLLTESGARHGHAYVINLASSSAKAGVGGFSAYSASKFGVLGFTQALNRELADTGVRASAICPSLVETAMTGAIPPEQAGRMLAVADIVRSVRYLLALSPGCLVQELVLTPPGGFVELGAL